MTHRSHCNFHPIKCTMFTKKSVGKNKSVSCKDEGFRNVLKLNRQIFEKP